jgi:hypothetical protein
MVSLAIFWLSYLPAWPGTLRGEEDRMLGCEQVHSQPNMRMPTTGNS